MFWNVKLWSNAPFTKPTFDGCY